VDDVGAGVGVGAVDRLDPFGLLEVPRVRGATGLESGGDQHAAEAAVEQQDAVG